MTLLYSEQEHLRQRRQSATQSRRTKRTAIVADFKRCLGCAVCGETDPDALDFHHRNPAEKSFTIAESLHRVSLAKLFAEIEKCQVLCASCHRKHHGKN